MAQPPLLSPPSWEWISAKQASKCVLSVWTSEHVRICNMRRGCAYFSAKPCNQNSGCITPSRAPSRAFLACMGSLAPLLQGPLKTEDMPGLRAAAVSQGGKGTRLAEGHRPLPEPTGPWLEEEAALLFPCPLVSLPGQVVGRTRARWPDPKSRAL